MATNLNVTELDFADIKNNLKNYLKQQTEFNDYDFEGSGLNILLDVLAYNTHYNALNAHYSLNTVLENQYSTTFINTWLEFCIRNLYNGYYPDREYYFR